MIRALAVAMIVLSPLAALAAGPYGKIVVGNWSGGAYTSEITGNFSHCAVTAGYRSGVRMLTSVTSDYKWLLGFSKPDWKLKPGNSLSLRLIFDGTSRIDVTAEVRQPTLITIAMPSDSALTRAFRQGHHLELIANDARFTFALTSTGEMLPALVDCVRQSANLKGPITRAAPSTAPAARTEDETKALAEKKALLEKTRDLIRTKMLACIGREGATMLLTDEKAEVVAKAAMIFCRTDVDALVQSTIEIIETEAGRPANRAAVKDAAEKRVHEVVVAHVVRSRGEMLNRRNQPPPATAPSTGLSPTL